MSRDGETRLGNVHQPNALTELWPIFIRFIYWPYLASAISLHILNSFSGVTYTDSHKRFFQILFCQLKFLTETVSH